MLNSKLLLISTTLMLSACASTTPIAVRTQQWQVPKPDPQLVAQEEAAQSKATDSLAAWNKWLLALPQAPAK